MNKKRLQEGTLGIMVSSLIFSSCVNQYQPKQDKAKKYNIYPLNDNALGHNAGGRFRSVYGLSKKVVLYSGIDQLLT